MTPLNIITNFTDKAIKLKEAYNREPGLIGNTPMLEHYKENLESNPTKTLIDIADYKEQFNRTMCNQERDLLDAFSKLDIPQNA